MRWLALLLIALALVVPPAVDWVETAHRLDVKRDFGILPWYVCGAAGLILLALSFRRSK
ncbi:MAG: hypothetical protein ABL957_04785 [Parvularculaceae bacterium]